MFELPTSILINNKEYNIRNKGDFRLILDIFNALNDKELEKDYRVYTALIMFYENINELDDINKFNGDELKEAIYKMFDFINCGQPESPTLVNKPILVDWNKDQQLIASAINTVAKQEIRLLDYLHWWTFMGYYLAIGESSFANIVSIRDKIKRGKKLEDYEKDFKRDNPQYFVWDSQTVEQQQMEDELRNSWNNGG